MKNRTSSHFFILVLIVLVTAVSHYSIYYGALIRGYETSTLTAARNLSLLALLAALPIFLKHVFKFKGNWTFDKETYPESPKIGGLFSRYDMHAAIGRWGSAISGLSPSNTRLICLIKRPPRASSRNWTIDRTRPGPSGRSRARSHDCARLRDVEHLCVADHCRLTEANGPEVIEGQYAPAAGAGGFFNPLR